MCGPTSSCSPRPSCPTPTGRPWVPLTCWQPGRKPLVPVSLLLLPLLPGALCTARARSKGLAESRWQRGGGRASQQASGGAAVRRGATGALVLTPHPGVEGKTELRAQGAQPQLYRPAGREQVGESRREKLLDPGFRKYPVLSPPPPAPAAPALAQPPAFLSRAYPFPHASKHRHTQIQRVPIGGELESSFGDDDV